MIKIEDKLNHIVLGISDYLSNYLSTRSCFGARSFYGESFTLALLSRTSHLTDDLEEKLLLEFKNKDRSDSQYHWEFNNYAMLEAGRLESSSLRFKNTPCTNWTLLRSNVRFRCNVDVDVASIEVDKKIKKMQLTSGMILDDPGVRSFQYHCFSAAMLYEIYICTNNNVYLKRFCKAVEFIRNFILPNGDTLYVGRGQQQSFGYASLIYILCGYYSVTKNNSVLGDVENVISLIRKFIRKDGQLEFPLHHF